MRVLNDATILKMYHLLRLGTSEDLLKKVVEEVTYRSPGEKADKYAPPQTPEIAGAALALADALLLQCTRKTCTFRGKYNIQKMRNMSCMF